MDIYEAIQTMRDAQAGLDVPREDRIVASSLVRYAEKLLASKEQERTWIYFVFTETQVKIGTSQDQRERRESR